MADNAVTTIAWSLTVHLDVRRHLAPLFEPIDAAFHDVATRVDSPLRVWYGLTR
jgi:hypothetical protein